MYALNLSTHVGASRVDMFVFGTVNSQSPSEYTYVMCAYQELTDCTLLLNSGKGQVRTPLSELEQEQNGAQSP